MAVKTYGKVGISPKGDWKADEEYRLLNLVSYNGSSYVVNTVSAEGTVPVGTLPTNTNYYQLSAQGGGIAQEDAPGVVKPDGATMEVSADGTLSVKTAGQNTLGIVKGSDDITVESDGLLKINTDFEQAVELGNIIAGEAINEVFGKVAKSIATLMNLNENALLKGMLTNQYENSINTIPTSALLYALRQDIINVNSNLKDLIIINTVSSASPTTITPNTANYIDIPFATPDGYKAISAYPRSTGNSLLFAVQCELKNSNTVTINLGNLSGSAREAKPFVNVVFIRDL